MILAGQIDKIEGQKVWVLVSPDGVGCGNNCTCERPVRKIEARNEAGFNLESGETVILKTKRSNWLGFILAAAAIAGGALTYNLTQSFGTNLQAGLSMGGAFVVGVLTALLLGVFRGSQFPAVQKISVQLHTNES